MAKDYAREFYNSGAWKECRTAYKSYRHHLCERCLKRGLIVPGVIVHHKVRISPDTINDPAVALNFDNLELLCRSCHDAEHDEERKAGLRKHGKHDRYVIDENGKVFAKK